MEISIVTIERIENYTKFLNEKFFLNLKKLYLYNCNNINYIPDTYINLKKLYINSCYKIKNMPKTLINLKYIKYIDYNKLDKLPKNIINNNNFINLKKYIFNDFIFIK